MIYKPFQDLNLSALGLGCMRLPQANDQIDIPAVKEMVAYAMAQGINYFDTAWGYHSAGETRTVDVHIKRLREKVNDHDNWRIATIWGIGYKFEVK